MLPFDATLLLASIAVAPGDRVRLWIVALEDIIQEKEPSLITAWLFASKTIFVLDIVYCQC